jgi:hypothetical protein
MAYKIYHMKSSGGQLGVWKTPSLSFGAFWWFSRFIFAISQFLSSIFKLFDNIFNSNSNYYCLKNLQARVLLVIHTLRVIRFKYNFPSAQKVRKKVNIITIFWKNTSKIDYTWKLSLPLLLLYYSTNDITYIRERKPPHRHRISQKTV